MTGNARPELENMPVNKKGETLASRASRHTEMAMDYRDNTKVRSRSIAHQCEE
ncbi:hypothetical protein [[Pantoea] beijingensis]|uniref:hypothetical protein n=1 Tax=[Pantoea] beijingensis TaxID=1324864 RepID=UPI0013E39A22|nr:hypothetical protein [[Pantoea] beijingensis]